ncbi:MAG: antibiotic biosynthesis monooxygenase [Alphaproteobacteria bacterium]|nr:antibiotic biosynthesis monooxygenase [Alphaproteobacteria bacterium SS10]
MTGITDHPGVVLVNPFTIFDGKEDAFLALWDQTEPLFREHPGYGRARLLRAIPGQVANQKAPFTHVNIAEWRSAADYEEALRHPDLRKIGGQYLKISTFNPALYEVIRDIAADRD